MKKKIKKHLTVIDRMIIQACIHDHRNITQIADRLNVSKSTISREIAKFKTYKLCSYPKCSNRWLGLCNPCPHKACIKDKYYYNFREAEIRSANLRSTSRSKSRLAPKDIAIVDQIVSEGVTLGQSLHHIYCSSPILEKICHERTIRRLCDRGNLSIRSHQLRRYVTYKHSYKKEPKESMLRDIRVLIGRTYKDYLAKFRRNKRLNIVQFDSVIGQINDEKAILTIAFPKYNFQFGILINKGYPNCVTGKIKRMFKKLGNDLVKVIFPINVADNGVEFSHFNQIEIDENGEKICSTYFTTPYRSTDKAECERNHELIRYMIPKGKSLDFLTQDIVDDMFSNINSYIRKSKGNQTPYDLVKRKFGKEFLDAINIKRIPNKKVKLTQIV